MKAYLILSDGHIFCGERFGAKGDAIGELVFTTTMGGYIETLTDPAYYGQIVVQTFPHIGNYGMINEDCESEKPHLSAYIVRDLCDEPSNFRSETTLDDYLIQNNIVGLSGIDTRELTKIIRENGVMPAKIVSELPSEKPIQLLEYFISNAVSTVSTKDEYVVSSKTSAKYNIAILDLGLKKSLINELQKFDCDITVLPHNTAYERMLGFDGIIISDGPGNPEENTLIIENVKKLLGKTPIFGIGLGHQIIALAEGAKIKKLKYGHRGASQPVRNNQSGKVFITNQNHGYVVVSESLSEEAVISHTNANDGSCEGIIYEQLNAFSIQFNPDIYLELNKPNPFFNKFMKMLGGSN